MSYVYVSLREPHAEVPDAVRIPPTVDGGLFVPGVSLESVILQLAPRVDVFFPLTEVIILDMVLTDLKLCGLAAVW